MDIVNLPYLIPTLLKARKGERPEISPIFDSPTQYGQMMLMFTISLVFGVMVPSLLPAAFVLFFLRYFAQKYKMIYR